MSRGGRSSSRYFWENFIQGFEFCFGHIRGSSKLSSRQQVTWAEEWPPQNARENPKQEGTKPSCLFPETQTRKSVPGFGGIPPLAACEESAQSFPVQTNSPPPPLLTDKPSLTALLFRAPAAVLSCAAWNEAFQRSQHS